MQQYPIGGKAFDQGPSTAIYLPPSTTSLVTSSSVPDSGYILVLRSVY